MVHGKKGGPWPLLLQPPASWPLGYFSRRDLSYSSESQHDRKNGHVAHSPVLSVSLMNSLPEAPVTPICVIRARHGGASDLHPCLLSQLIQYPPLGFMSSTSPCGNRNRPKTSLFEKRAPRLYNIHVSWYTDNSLRRP